MTVLFNIMIWAHVATGFTGLVAFWVPVFARKGGTLHTRAGTVYARCAYVVTLSAVVACVWRGVSYMAAGIGLTEQPQLYGFALFLGYLGVSTFAAVRQSIRAVQTRRAPETLRTPFHEGLAYASMVGSVAVITFALAFWSEASPILLALSPIGIFTGRRMLNLMHNPGSEHMGWFYSHMGSMLGGGNRVSHGVCGLRVAAALGLLIRGRAWNPAVDPPDSYRYPGHLSWNAVLPETFREDRRSTDGLVS